MTRSFFTRLTPLALLGLAVACGGVDPDLDDAYLMSTEDGLVGEEPEGYEPNEDDPNLADMVGWKAIETFELHKLARDQGLEPSDEYPLTTATVDDVGTTVSGVVTRRTIYGHVRDQYGRGVASVRVTAFDSDPGTDDLMGRVYTDRNGYYEIHYRGGHWDPCPHRWTCWRPDIYVTVSARDWKVQGDRYDGKPLCRNVTYGWNRVRRSRGYGNWRLRNSLRVNLTTRPRNEIWEERSDKPDCLRGPFCYNFSYITTSCRGVVESLTGCSGGYEYSWRAACLGWFSAVLDSRRLCFDTPKDRGGVCEGAEAPGGNQGPRDGYDAPCQENPYGGCG